MPTLLVVLAAAAGLPALGLLAAYGYYNWTPEARRRDKRIRRGLEEEAECRRRHP